MTAAADPKKPCDLCSLPVGAKPCVLPLAERRLDFCCEGCLGIYQMLHDIKDIPAPLPDNAVAKP